MMDKSEAIKRVGPVCRPFDPFTALQAASDHLLKIDMISCLSLLHWVSREVASMAVSWFAAKLCVLVFNYVDIVVFTTHSYSHPKKSQITSFSLCMVEY